MHCILLLKTLIATHDITNASFNTGAFRYSSASHCILNIDRVNSLIYYLILLVCLNYVLFENILLIRKRHQCRLRADKLTPLLIKS